MTAKESVLARKNIHR